ncbi:MAG: radical SAM protein [Candidatus Lokiarchaeota archaeon]|nr:radical SAM protein [Candidatus Lokiarchaeota archaeon]
MVRYEVKEFKSIVNKLKFIDSWFWCAYTVNPYNGCYHDCIYCDGRTRKYNMHADFEETVYVKVGAAEALDKKIRQGRAMLPDVVSMGGVCDAYQPAEAEYGITRGILEVLHKHGFPAFLLTKSDLITRDLDVISAINQRSWATVAFTVTTVDDGLARVLEPGASPPSRRLEALRRVKARDPRIQTGVCAMPIIPFLEDADGAIESLVASTKEAGCDFLLFAPGVSMRDEQASYLLRKMEAAFPKEHGLFVDKYLKDDAFRATWTRETNDKLLAACKGLGLAVRARRFIPADHRKHNYAIAERLLNEAYELQLAGGRWKGHFWAGQAVQMLREPVADVHARGGLRGIKGMTAAVAAEIEPWIPARQGLDRFIPGKARE